MGRRPCRLSIGRLLGILGAASDYHCDGFYLAAGIGRFTIAVIDHPRVIDHHRAHVWTITIAFGGDVHGEAPISGLLAKGTNPLSAVARSCSGPTSPW